MTSRSDMHHDLHEYLPEMSLREKFETWITYYWWPTRRWMPKVSMWWAYSVRRYPKPPPLAEDRIALHFGFVEGVPPCTDGPICAEHGWKVPPLVEQSEAGASGDPPPPENDLLVPDCPGS